MGELKKRFRVQGMGDNKGFRVCGIRNRFRV